LMPLRAVLPIAHGFSPMMAYAEYMPPVQPVKALRVRRRAHTLFRIPKKTRFQPRRPTGITRDHDQNPST
ncbi:MAG: hypothetical protein RJQ08_01585, partial [Salinisphaeraceae bacterium]|uniref:hypothetical protein n=1 Tax=Marinobacter salarius TaxID=1420917 RepID=UPI0032EFEE9D